MTVNGRRKGTRTMHLCVADLLWILLWSDSLHSPRTTFAPITPAPIFPLSHPSPFSPLHSLTRLLPLSFTPSPFQSLTLPLSHPSSLSLFLSPTWFTVCAPAAPCAATASTSAARTTSTAPPATASWLPALPLPLMALMALMALALPPLPLLLAPTDGRGGDAIELMMLTSTEGRFLCSSRRLLVEGLLVPERLSGCKRDNGRGTSKTEAEARVRGRSISEAEAQARQWHE